MATNYIEIKGIVSENIPKSRDNCDVKYTYEYLGIHYQDVTYLRKNCEQYTIGQKKSIKIAQRNPVISQLENRLE